MQQGRGRNAATPWWQPAFAQKICLHALRLVNSLTIGVKAVRVHYEKAMFSAACFKRLVW